MSRFLLRTERMRAPTRVEEQILRRLERKERGIRTASSRLLPLWLARSKLSAMAVEVVIIAGLRIVVAAAAVRDVPESNCAFHVFPREDRLVLPFDKDLDIRWGHGEGKGEVAQSLTTCGCGGKRFGALG